MHERNSLKRKNVRDPHQRTVTGRIIHVVWLFVAAAMLISATLGIGGGVAAYKLLNRTKQYLDEDIKPQAHYSLEGQKLNQTSFIYAKNPKTGEYEELRQLLAVENRIWVAYDEIPADLVNAAVAIEDKRFWEHDGVDWMRTLAASANMFIGGSTYGGSTITQQLIKNLSQDKEVTVRRKLMEIYRALDFEKHYTKEEILEWYLNTIFLGEGAYGVKSAANIYFGKELDELTPKECACIIGITNNPSLYDPYIYPKNNEKRTLTILQQMHEQGYIEDEDYDAVCDQKLEFKSLVLPNQTFVCTECDFEGEIDEYTEDGDYYLCPVCEHKNQFNVEKPDYYTYFEDQVIRDVTRDLAAKLELSTEAASQMVTTGGFIIYSTIDLEAQAKVDAIYSDPANVPATYSSQQMQSAIIVIDNETGDIVAMAGGVGEKKGNLTLNRATQSRLSPGSSIKPLTVYGPALAMGIITPGSAYEDSPYTKIDGRDWPQNETRRYSGWMIVNYGVAQSLNTIAVKVLADVTPEKSFAFAKEHFMLNGLVETEEINGTTFTDVSLAPLGMGQLTHGLTVREMASAYATFPNGGVYRQGRTYTKVVDSEGRVVLDNTQKTNSAMDPHAAWYMVSMLQYACQYGTGTPAQVPGVPCAGKTGTTSSNRDRWFCGFTPRYTASVWCGFDNPEEVRPVINLNPSSLMWKAVMTSLYEDVPKDEIGDFEMPTDEKMVYCTVCNQTGLLAGPLCKGRSIQLFESDAPKVTCANHAGFDVKLCYPDGKSGTAYCCGTYCEAYHNLVTSPEFQTLAEKYPALRQFAVNELEDQKIVVYKDGDTDNSANLETALKENHLTYCPVHTLEQFEALGNAIAEARAAEQTPEQPTEPSDEPNDPDDPDEPDPWP